MNIDNTKAIKYFIIGTFVTLYLLVSVISTIHVIDFFKISNPDWLAISLAVAFEVGAAASLASIIALQKMNKGIVWMLFIILTAMQAMGNTFYAYTHLHDFQGWIELFGLNEEELIYQKRILSLVSGAILPIVALGFIKSLVDYIKPADETEDIREEIIQAEISALEEKLEKEIPQPQKAAKQSVTQPIIETDPFRMDARGMSAIANTGEKVNEDAQIDNKKSSAPPAKKANPDNILGHNGRL